MRRGEHCASRTASFSMRILRKAGDVPKRSLWQRIKDVALMDVGVLARGGVSAGSLEQLEELLLEADFGVPVTLRLVAEVERLRQARRGEDRRTSSTTRSRRASTRRCAPATAIRALDARRDGADGHSRRRRERRGQDDVHRQARRRAFARERKRVMVAAGDTFRAGAIDQLRVWAERTGAEFVGATAGRRSRRRRVRRDRRRRRARRRRR